MQLQGVIEFFGGATVISVVMGYLGKKAIEAYLSGRIEDYKNNLERIATEHSIRFQSLHSERAEVIKEFYGKLVGLDEALHSTLRPLQSLGEPELKKKVSDLAKRFNDLRDYFLPKRIFFDEDVCSLIDQILEAAKDVFYDITTYPVEPQDKTYKDQPGLIDERHAFWTTARKIHKTEIVSLKNELEREFREILGIKTKDLS